MTVKEIKDRISSRLEEAGIEDHIYESWLFLEWKLGISRADYYMDPEAQVDEDRLEDLEKALARRQAREPMAYIMGRSEFMGYSFLTDNRVLIPRQDTECLVELAADRIRTRSDRGAGLRILDLCTGSGCIGICIKKMFPKAEVVLSDHSEGALEVAGENARQLQAEVEILKGDLFDPVSGTFDLILSNPPYIPSEVVDGLMPEVADYEPRTALDGEADGLYYYRKIVAQAPAYLKEEGFLLLEIGHDQGRDLETLLEEAGFTDISIEKDLAGLDRIACGTWGVPRLG